MTTIDDETISDERAMKLALAERLDRYAADCEADKMTGHATDLRDAAAALRSPVPADDRPKREPFLWICLVPGQWEPENIRAWTRDPDQAANWIEQGLDMKALYASASPNQGEG